MKKKRDDSVSLSLKVTRIMKITLILILVGVIQVSATTYAQEHRISVSVKNGTFYDVVSQIERQSEFMFFYKSEEIDGNQRINLNAKKEELAHRENWALPPLGKGGDFMPHRRLWRNDAPWVRNMRTTKRKRRKFHVIS